MHMENASDSSERPSKLDSERGLTPTDVSPNECSGGWPPSIILKNSQTLISRNPASHLSSGRAREQKTYYYARGKGAMKKKNNNIGS